MQGAGQQVGVGLVRLLQRLLGSTVNQGIKGRVKTLNSVKKAPHQAR